MNLTPEQKETVAGWVAAGDGLSVIQKKLTDQFKVSMTYMDVRFLVDDLNLQLRDPAPKADASDVGKPPAARPGAPGAEGRVEKKGFLEKAKEKLGLGKDEGADEMPHGAEDGDLGVDDLPPAGAGGSARVIVDKVTLIPGAMASGTVAFPDGVTGKWIVDNYGRPGLTEVSKPGYRPTPADAQAFMQELGLALQGRGL